MTEERETRWQQLRGQVTGADYAAHFEKLERSGRDVHGEAAFCDGLVPRGATVLDAGCGTGRVGIRLAQLGHHVVGVDVDSSMLAVAREKAPEVTWLEGDLSRLPEQARGLGPYDLVVLAGNVVPLLAEGTLDATAAGLASVTAGSGLVVAGFGLDPAHLPPGCPVTPLEEYDEAMTGHGFVLDARFATWDGDAFDPSAGYAVSLHRPAGLSTRG